MIWPKARLGDLIEVISGFALKSKLFNEHKGRPVIRIRDVLRGHSETFTTEECSSKYVVENGDLLVGMDGNFNSAFWTGGPALLNQRVCKLVPKPPLNISYLGYFIPNALEEIERQTPFVTVKHLSVKKIEAIEIPLPPLSEQKRIAEILDCADAIRRTRQETLKTCDELLRSTFLEMFGDPVTNPMGWEVRELGEVLEFLTSGSRGWAKYYSSSGDLFLRIQNVKESRLKFDDVILVNAPDSAEAKRTKVKHGDVLLSITADLGRTAVISEDCPIAYINQHLAILRVNKSILNPYFLSLFLSTEGGQLQFAALNKGGVKAGLNFNDIKSLKILVPPIEQQFRAEMLFNRQQELETELKASTKQEDTLFNSLVQRAFRGEL